MFTEDITAFFDETTGFAIPALLAGSSSPVSVIMDEADDESYDVLSRQPSVLLPTMLNTVREKDQVTIPVSGLQPHLLHLAGDYIVRAVRREAADGALTRLTLARA